MNEDTAGTRQTNVGNDDNTFDDGAYNEEDQEEHQVRTPSIPRLGLASAANIPVETAESIRIDHATLKYSLLGPSLTKSGQDNVDQSKVSEIIYNASKGSKFFNREEVRDKNLTEKISRIKARQKQLEKLDLSSELRKADEYITELELSRDLSQYCVHVDCDAFYAAVEELDRPELQDVPMAVGKGVLTTCNYHARKFGCRSGMAGFVAMKLCPQLVCLPLNFEKYTAKAQEVRAVLAEYDPRFESASIDEAYLNITEYCDLNQLEPDDVVSQMRAEVFEKAKITISAGIAANAKLAKICSNKNKPNGQFRLANDRATVMSFMRELPTRKVNGVGRVFERELDAIGVKLCGDIYTYRAYLSRLFGEKAFQFLMGCYLGLGRTVIRPAEEYERKSVGTESTFRDMSDPGELRAKLRHTAEELEGDLKRTQCKGRTLVIKIKLHTYEVYTRQTVLPKAMCLADDLYRYSAPMLSKLEKELPGMKLRLMGLRVTHLVSTKKQGIDFFGLKKGLMEGSADESRQSNVHNYSTSMSNGGDGEWEVWPEEEFEQAALQERQDEMNEIEALSQETGVGESEQLTSPQRLHGRLVVPNPTPDREKQRQKLNSVAEQYWCCPICSRPQSAVDKDFNEHIDLCLSRQTIEEAVKETASIESSNIKTENPRFASVKDVLLGTNAPHPSSGLRKRGRPVGNGAGVGASDEKGEVSGHTQKKLFFFAASD